MRKISPPLIADTIKSLCIDAAHRLPDDVVQAIRRAEQQETDSRARHLLKLTLDNAEQAVEKMIPLCQDTGVTVVFVEQGDQVMVDGNLIDAINQGVAMGYDEGYLRKSIVDDPVNLRKNTGTNTPAIIHHSFVHGDRLKLTVMLKGGGCENKSQLKMLTPADGRGGVVEFVIETVKKAGGDACPPFIVGVGIGGTFEIACLAAKHALLRPLNVQHCDPYYAEMEQALTAAINDLGIGPQGMGGRTTTLATLIETHPCHIASLPVAVNIECHSHRHKAQTI